MNRINLFGPTVGDVLLANAWCCKIELCRSCDEDAGDGELSVSYELRGEVPADADPAGMLASLIAALQSPRGGMEGAV